MKELCHVKVPCNNCPFRRKGGIRLHRARVIEVASCAGNFPCHKTVDHDARNFATELQCAGALIIAYKGDGATQLMRIAERLGVMDHKLADDPWPEIFDDLDEMLDSAISTRKAKRR